MAGAIIAARMAGGTYVSPFASEEAILEFFRLHADAIRVQAFAVFGSAVPLGIYAATVVSRLNYLGVRAAGSTIALFGGFGASFILAISGMVQWVLSRHSIGANAPATLSWQDFAFMTGGPGYASMLGLLIAGVSVPALFSRFLPRWLCLSGDCDRTCRPAIGSVAPLPVGCLLCSADALSGICLVDPVRPQASAQRSNTGRSVAKCESQYASG